MPSGDGAAPLLAPIEASSVREPFVAAHELFHPTVPAPDADAAPTIALCGPETVRVSRKRRALRLVVFSSGAGRLEVEAGGTRLGLGDLRAGGNELRFTLPKNLLRALAANGRLRVTSISSGGARGATVTRKLVLTK